MKISYQKYYWKRSHRACFTYLSTDVCIVFLHIHKCNGLDVQVRCINTCMYTTLFVNKAQLTWYYRCEMIHVYFHIILSLLHVIISSIILKNICAMTSTVQFYLHNSLKGCLRRPFYHPLEMGVKPIVELFEKMK